MSGPGWSPGGGEWWEGQTGLSPSSVFLQGGWLSFSTAGHRLTVT